MGAQLTTREVADLLGVEVWQIRRIYKSGNLPEPPRAGLYRLIPRTDLPLIIDALRNRGWLSAPTTTEPSPC